MTTYIFDIDGTICNSSGGDYSTATPKENRIKKVNQLYGEGHTIIFLTARGMGRFNNNSLLANEEFYDLTLGQLNDWGVNYHKLFLGKPAGDAYIDDKGINDYDFFKD
tara:strand:+ start:60 stop:383 length:324 start_codon:yes stop_codon:yes gene_type:complete